MRRSASTRPRHEVGQSTIKEKAVTYQEHDPDNGEVPRKPDELNAEQIAALDTARKAQRRFERAQLGYEAALQERTAAFRAARDADLSWGELADAFGWTRSTAQAVVA